MQQLNQESQRTMGNGEINEGNDSSKQRMQLVEKLKIILLILCYKDYKKDKASIYRIKLTARVKITTYKLNARQMPVLAAYIFDIYCSNKLLRILNTVISLLQQQLFYY